MAQAGRFVTWGFLEFLQTVVTTARMAYLLLTSFPGTTTITIWPCLRTEYRLSQQANVYWRKADCIKKIYQNQSKTIQAKSTRLQRVWQLQCHLLIFGCLQCRIPPFVKTTCPLSVGGGGFLSPKFCELGFIPTQQEQEGIIA